MYMNTVLEKVAMVPGYAAKHAEDRKFLADMTSRKPIYAVNGGPHILVFFAIEDGGKLGAHAQALLSALAITTLAKGRTPPFAKGVEQMTHTILVSLWVRRCQKTPFRMASSSHLPPCCASPLPGRCSPSWIPLGRIAMRR